MSTLNDVKKRIRALLISVKGGCTLKALYEDYRFVIGEQLPYSRFGYKTLVSFIKTMPDVVSIRVRDGNTLLYAVPDNNTQHLSRLVSRQRSSRSAAYTQPPPRRKQPLKRIPEAFVLQLKQLFLSYPNGIALDRFNEAFGRRFGYYVKFTPWGYTTLEELLEDTEGTELVHDPLKGSCIVKPQRKGKNLTLKMNPTAPDSLHALESSPVEKKSMEKCLKKETATSSEAEGTTKQDKTSFKQVIPDVLVRNIKELLKANSAGVWLSQFCTLYKDFFGEEFPFFTHSYSTPLHLLSSLPDCCVILRPQVGNGDWLVTAVGSIVNVAPNHGFNSVAYISSKLSTTIHQMLAPSAPSAPEGIPICSFLAAYKDYTGTELNMKELGFNTLVELLERVDGVRVMKPPGTEFMMVSGPSKKNRGKKKSSSGDTATSSDISTDNESQVSSRPPGSMASGYKKQAVPTEKKMVGVYVTHVHTPSCMCVQLIGEHTTRALEYLLEDITQFYNSPKGDIYQLNKPHIGQPCCALFNNDGYWYRAEVVSIPTSDITEVLYVDYGNTGRVPTASLRKTKPHYMILPAQAVKCRLAHLKPAGSRWSMQASSLLFQMTKDKPIVAIASAIVNDLISACLCDTTSEEDIHINDTLVSQGLAIYLKDTEEEEKKYDGYLPESTPQGAADTPTVRAPNDSKPQPLSTNTSNSSQHPSTNTPSHTTSLKSPSPSINHLQSTPSNNPSIPTSINSIPPVSSATSSAPPPGFSVQPTSQDSTNFMNNYLLNLFVQQAYLTGLTGSAPTAINQLLTGQSGLGPGLFPACPPGMGPVNSLPPELSSSNSQPNQTCPTSISQPYQTSTTSITEQVKSEKTAQPSPSIHTPTTVTSTSTPSREEEEDEESSPSTNMMMIKKCQLTPQHCLHVLRHSNRAYVLSPQVSRWFWDTDLLQSMLRQVHNSRQVWGLLLQSHRAYDLFREMKNDPILRSLICGKNEVTVYALEDLPSIVSMFHGTAALCSAVKLQCNEWLQKELAYFEESDTELEKITTSLQELKTKRTQILASLSEDGEEETVDKGALELVKVTKSISKLKATLAALVSQKITTSTTEESDDTHSQRGDHERSLREDSRPPSRRERGTLCFSQTSEYDDTFASTVSELTPDPSSPITMKSSEIYPTTYTEASSVLPSSFNSSSSSSLSSLSDLPVFIPPLTPKKDSIEGEASKKPLQAPVSYKSTVTAKNSSQIHQKAVTTAQDCIRTKDESRMESVATPVVRNCFSSWNENQHNVSEVHSPVKDNTPEDVASSTQSAESSSGASKWSLGEQLKSLGRAPERQGLSTCRLDQNSRIYTCKTRSSSCSDNSPSTGQSHRKPNSAAEDGLVRSGNAFSGNWSAGKANSTGNSGLQTSNNCSRRYSSPRRQRGQFRPYSQGSARPPFQFSKLDVSFVDIPSKKPERGNSSSPGSPKYILKPVDFTSSSSSPSPSDVLLDLKDFPSSLAQNKTHVSPIPVTTSITTPSLQDVRETLSSSISIKTSDLSSEYWETLSEPDLYEQDSKEEDSEGILELVSGDVCDGVDPEKIANTLSVIEQLESAEQSQDVCIKEKSEVTEVTPDDAVAVEEMHNVKEGTEDENQVVTNEITGNVVEGECSEASDGDNSEMVTCDYGELGTSEVATKENKDCTVAVNTRDGVASGDDGKVSSEAVKRVDGVPHEATVGLCGLEDWCKEMELRGYPESVDTVKQEQENIMEKTTQGMQHTSDEPSIELLIDIGGYSENSQKADRGLIGGTAGQSEVMGNSVDLLDHCNQEQSQLNVKFEEEEDDLIDCASDRNETLISDVDDQNKVIDLPKSKQRECGEMEQPTNDSPLVTDGKMINDGSSTPHVTSPTMAGLEESIKVSSELSCISWISLPRKTESPTFEPTASLRPTRSFRSRMVCKTSPKPLKPAGLSVSAVRPRAPHPPITTPRLSLPAVSLSTTSKAASSKPQCSSNSSYKHSQSVPLTSPHLTTTVSPPILSQGSPPVYTNSTHSCLPLRPPTNIAYPAAYPMSPSPFISHTPSPSLCSLVPLEPFLPGQPPPYMPPHGTVIDWTDGRPIEFVPGHPIDSPSGVILPGYPDPYLDVFGVPPYCSPSGTWHITTPRPQ